MISENDLNALVDAQQSPFGAKISRLGHYHNRFIYHLSEDSFEEDLDFLKNCTPYNMVASIFPKNPYSEFGFKNISRKNIQAILSVVRHVQISTLLENTSEILMGEHLETLNFSGPLDEKVKHASSKTILDLKALVNLNSLGLPVNSHSSSAINFSENRSLKELRASHLKTDGANCSSHLKNLSELRVLDLFRCKVTDFEFISNLKDLKFLEYSYSRSIRDVSVLGSLYNLERIDFENCPNLENLEALAKLPKLRVLRLNKCRSVQSLSFLQDTGIECLEFYGTSIEDNDLSFLSQMQNLKIVRYSHKRSYNVPNGRTMDEKIDSDLWYRCTYDISQYLD